VGVLAGRSPPLPAAAAGPTSRTRQRRPPPKSDTPDRYGPRRPVARSLHRPDALDFPELSIVCGHIGYPRTEEMIAVARKHPGVYIDTPPAPPNGNQPNWSLREDSERTDQSALRHKLSDDRPPPCVGRHRGPRSRRGRPSRYLHGNADAEGTRWTAQIRPTVADVFRIHAQRYGSRIRHEDEKHASAISMRILQTCR
jgi:hypothetical protein